MTGLKNLIQLILKKYSKVGNSKITPDEVMIYKMHAMQCNAIIPMNSYVCPDYGMSMEVMDT